MMERQKETMLVILPPNEYSGKLRDLLGPLVPEGCVFHDPADGLEGLRGKKLLFAVALDEGGCNPAYYQMLSALRRGDGLLEGCIAGVVVTGVGELYTKDVARDLVLAANLAGCAFLGRPLVEATGSLRNFQVQAQIHGTDERTAFRMAAAELVGRLTDWEGLPPPRRVLALHASARATSNTLAANLTAFVNRLTALFRQSRFYDKRLYGLIVSGYSGGDLIARQLISGLNMNKSFYLPPRFCMLETANEKGSLVKLPGIAQRGAAFAARMMAE